MAGERRPRRRGTVIADPFSVLRHADQQQLDEHHQRWARMSFSRGTPAAPVRPTFQREIRPDPGEHDVDGADDGDVYRNGGLGAVLASRDAIAGLPEVAAGEATREKECAVCLEGFGEGEKLRKMPCPDSHVFHEDCILEWLGVSRLCPLCRFALPPAEEETEADIASDAETETESTEAEEEEVGAYNLAVFLM